MLCERKNGSQRIASHRSASDAFQHVLADRTRDVMNMNSLQLIGAAIIGDLTASSISGKNIDRHAATQTSAAHKIPAVPHLHHMAGHAQ